MATIKKQLSNHAAAAKLMRQDLKKAYPLTAFTIRSNSYAGGNSVHVEWMNGPVYDDVTKIVGKYQYGDFDGMTDCYDMTNVRNDIPQVKYVQVRREVSEDIKQQIFEQLRKTHVGWENLSSMDECNDELKKHWCVWTARDYIYRITQKQDLTHGYKVA